MGPGVGPPAVGQRLGWADAPAWLRDEVERRLGAGVVEAVTQPGGFSPGVAARLRLADGSRLPPPPGLPTLRAFQHGQAVVALEWLRLRTGWP